MAKIILMIDQLLERISRYGLICCLFIILIFAVLAILLRWLGSSVMWIEPMVRHVVFLSAFLGGSLATSKGVHIKVDLLTKLVEHSRSRLLKWVHQNLITAFCFLTCLLLSKTAFDFFQVEREFGAPAFLDIHSSWLVGIIPFGMGLITLRFLNQLILGLFSGDSSASHRV
jgi:TRAP-type C4-dicarboxylate transport system permease small subunit